MMWFELRMSEVMWSVKREFHVCERALVTRDYGMGKACEVNEEVGD